MSDKHVQVALCVGHSRRGDNGAASVTGVTEWDFNAELANLTLSRLREMGIGGEVIGEYPASSYGAAMQWLGQEVKRIGARVAIELHFNAASNPRAQGFEYLHFPGSTNGERLAQCLHDSQAKQYPFAISRGIKTPVNGRGMGFLRHTPCPAAITEPFFGTNAHEWAEYSENATTLAMTYAEGLRNYLT